MGALSAVPAGWCEVTLKKWENINDHDLGHVKDKDSPKLTDDYEFRRVASPDQTLYVTDTRADVRIKFVAIVLFSPLIFLFKIIFRIGRLVTQVGINLAKGRFWEAIKNGAKSLRDVVQTPFLVLGEVACAVYGWFDPFVGRIGVGSLEKIENHGAHFPQSCMESSSGLDNCDPFTSKSGVMYLYPCMQSRGHLSDPKFDVTKWVPV